MNTRSYINNMGITKLSVFELSVIKRFKENYPSWVKELTDNEIYNLFRNTMSYNLIRLNVANSAFGFSLGDAIMQDIRKVKRWWEFWK